ncbi:oplophorus-luciferin 2-monooxygenase non-catalytic subunit [Procambarus clarkii]|uniref:oplophorus-luciferin 2-monooxygenase non-catalytic subunit n=1 Tax=Procambarus clarkii TaxID=6728 RepID=UPI001E673545|nr:oplophorus-luciferin 2-monooxygenase non-catalytic subunit-like [Procambarus clarkii]
MVTLPFKILVNIILSSTVHDLVSSDPTPNCPNPDQIFPCTCSESTFPNLIMDCSDVTSEEELAAVFSANFPKLNFHEFIMRNNTHVRVLREGALGNTTYQEFSITNGVLEEIEDHALSGSFSTAHKFDFSFNKISTFPFQDLSQFPKLLQLYLNTNNLTEFPQMVSPSLQWLEMAENPLGYLPADAFTYLPSLILLTLSSDDLHEIIPGTLSNLSNLEYITLSKNHFTHLSKDAVHLQNLRGMVNFSFNNITNVAVDAFEGMTSGQIYLSHNQLTTLQEEVWRPLLELEIFITADNNPFTCGCDMAWVVLNTNFIYLFSYTTKCDDGRYFRELDPADYVLC